MIGFEPMTCRLLAAALNQTELHSNAENVSSLMNNFRFPSLN